MYMEREREGWAKTFTMNWGIESLFASYSDANTRVSGFDS
jgi:hypothetical protein